MLSKDTKIKRSTLIECLNTLVELGLIRKVKRYRGNLKTSNIYELQMPESP